MLRIVMQWFPLTFCIAVAPLISKRCYSIIDKSLLDTNNAVANVLVASYRGHGLPGMFSNKNLF